MSAAAFDIRAACLALRGQISAGRDYLHTHPELSGQEERTLAWIERRLIQMGLSAVRVDHGGLVCVLDGRGPGKRLLLRADVDALPVPESGRNLTGPKRAVSQAKGVSHACGHDAHTVMLLAALQVLAAHRGDWEGQVVAVFEQGEETSYGVIPLLEYLEEHFDGMDGCFALHVYAGAPEGTLSVQPGYVMCGAAGFDVVLTGKGGHSSRPDLCNNPVDCFVSIYNDLAAVRMRHTDPNDCLTYAVGLLQGGSKSNVIPDSLRFSCLARFFNEDTCGRPFMEAAKAIVEKDAQIYDCGVQYNYIMEPVPGVYNDGACAALAQRSLRRTLGEAAVVPAAPWMASESLSVYHAMYRGVLAFLGIGDGQGYGAPHHSAQFDLNPDSLYLGAAAMVSYALDFLDPGFVPPPQKPAGRVLARFKKELS